MSGESFGVAYRNAVGVLGSFTVDDIEVNEQMIDVEDHPRAVVTYMACTDQKGPHFRLLARVEIGKVGFLVMGPEAALLSIRAEAHAKIKHECRKAGVKVISVLARTKMLHDKLSELEDGRFGR